MKTLTVEKIMAFEPCYNRAQVEALFGRRRRVRLTEIIDADAVPVQDRIWLLTQDGVLTPEQRRTFCDRTADRAVRAHCLTCGTASVEAWAAGWLSGEDRTEKTAWAAAWAADDAARAARAASAAAWDAGDAARAAWDAARAAQIADFRDIVEEKDK